MDAAVARAARPLGEVRSPTISVSGRARSTLTSYAWWPLRTCATASLIYDGNIKTSLLDYIHTSLLFADRGVDTNIISLNRYHALFKRNSHS